MKSNIINHLISFLLYLILISINSSTSIKAENLTKNKIIILIGDGMGTADLSLLKSAWDYGRKYNLVPDRDSSYDILLKLADVSLLTVKPDKYLVNDSACAASNISTGKNCLPETLGLDNNLQEIQVFSDFALKNNISLGIISDTRLTHATPAAFYSNSIHRSKEQNISKQLIKSKTRLALSGGGKFFTAPIPDFYNVARSKTELMSADKLPLLGIFSDGNMNDSFNESVKDSPTLLDMTKKSLELFSNESSFLLVIEAGQIDWASHSNDAGWLLHEMLKFEKTLNYLLNFTIKNPEYSLIVLSDHSTGGFAFSYKTKETSMFDKISSIGNKYSSQYNFIDEHILHTLITQKISINQLSQKIENQKNEQYISFLIEKHLSDYPSKIRKRIVEFCLKDKSEKEKIVKKIYNNKIKNYPYLDSFISQYISYELSNYQGVVWSTGTHTSSLIPFLLYGKHQKAKYQKPLSLSDVGILLRKFYTDPF